MAADIEIYFCDPRSPWQRGSNENTDRLLRQYLPRGTDLSVQPSQTQCNRDAAQRAPKKDFLYQTPVERLQSVLLRSVEPALETGRRISLSD